jgi:maltose alpha-D-glucosyltransferase/alpha-amylase
MGDNIFLGDRDGVRTPMQWTSDRNGGFRRAAPQRLYLPPIMDPIYGYEAVNVEAQAREPSSLLNWMRRLLVVRATSRAFGRGRFTMLHPGNRKILAYLREHDEDVVLCVANLARSAQPVELELGAYRGRVPVEMLGGHPFPPIGELPYLLTLPAHGFFWFRLSTDAQPPDWHVERLPIEDLPVLVLFDGWNSFFRSKVVPWRIAMAEKTRQRLERELFPRFLARQRWYAAKGEPVERAELAESALLGGRREQWLIALFDVKGRAGTTRYFAPLAIAYDDHDDERARALAPVAVSKVRQQALVGVLGDAMADEAFCRSLVQAIGDARELKTEPAGGLLRFVRGARFDTVVGDSLAAPLPVKRLTTSSNSVSLLGEKLFLKAYRRPSTGINPELEIGRFLTDVAGYRYAVPVAGSVEHVAPDGTVSTLALLQAQLVNQGDAWTLAVEQLVRLLQSQAAPDAAPDAGIAAMAERLQLLARRVA